MIDLAIISGTGFYDFPGLEREEGLTIETRYGVASIPGTAKVTVSCPT